MDGSIRLMVTISVNTVLVERLSVVRRYLYEKNNCSTENWDYHYLLPVIYFVNDVLNGIKPHHMLRKDRQRSSTKVGLNEGSLK